MPGCSIRPSASWTRRCSPRCAAGPVRPMTDNLTLKLGWVIVYVEDPVATSAFDERAFGLRAEFAAPDGSYAQCDTGPTKLAFAAYAPPARRLRPRPVRDAR